MYQGNNPSALRSREEIVNAFMTLLQHSSIDRITIKQIMDTAGLSRQTFYQIFSSKEEILEYYLDTVFGKFTAHCRINTVHNLCDAARLFFGFFEEYKDSLGLIIRSGNTVYCKTMPGVSAKRKICALRTPRNPHSAGAGICRCFCHMRHGGNAGTMDPGRRRKQTERPGSGAARLPYYRII